MVFVTSAGVPKSVVVFVTSSIFWTSFFKTKTKTKNIFSIITVLTKTLCFFFFLLKASVCVCHDLLTLADLVFPLVGPKGRRIWANCWRRIFFVCISVCIHVCVLLQALLTHRVRCRSVPPLGCLLQSPCRAVWWVSFSRPLTRDRFCANSLGLSGEPFRNWIYKWTW